MRSAFEGPRGEDVPGGGGAEVIFADVDQQRPDRRRTFMFGAELGAKSDWFDIHIFLKLERGSGPPDRDQRTTSNCWG